jgi:xanthine dehydrogenase YagT iron-sulfur-binding subunit
VTEHVATRDIELSGAEIRERMSGNLCRCGAYNGIVSAIESVAATEPVS